MDRPVIIDQQRREQDWDWLVANFGAINLERAKVLGKEDKVFRIKKLQESEGPAVQIVHVADRDGNPLEGVTVVRHWPDAPQLPTWPPPTSLWRDRGVHGKTNVQGDIGFGMGRGDYYFAPSGGASAVWVAHPAGPSDLISGLGMLGGTNHRHLDVYYQLEEPATPPAPEPSPSPPPPLPPDPPPTPSPTPSSGFAILDKDGGSQSLGWLEHRFGTVEHYATSETNAYRLVELREVEGIHECQVTILDEHGKPEEGVPVSFRRRDGTGSKVQETGVDGTVRFPLESDAKYPVPGQGPYLSLVKKAAGSSDAVIGLGRVMRTPRHLDVTFQMVPGQAPSPPAPSPPSPEPPSPPPEPPPPPPPSDEEWERLLGRLDYIITILEERLGDSAD